MTKNLLAFILISSLSLNAFAITEQIQEATQFLTQLSTQVIDPDEIMNPHAIAPKKEIKYGQQSPLVTEYQKQNGLTETGVLDEETLKNVQEAQELNGFNITQTLDYNTWFATYEQSQLWQKTTVEQALTNWQSILQKQTNNGSAKFIVVNIPSMTLTAYEWNRETNQSTVALTSKVVIGKPSSETPLDDFVVWGIKYNPTWTPTSNMLKKNVFKGDKINTQWLQSHHIKALNSEGNEVAYSDISKGENLRFVQPAGNSNALGILKFETNSKENIYLHDTNEKNLFKHNVRSYSSGCVRVESFLALAQWAANIDEKTLNKKLANKQTRIEKINEQIPVYFSYNQVQFIGSRAIFSMDVYNKNKNTDFK